MTLEEFGKPLDYTKSMLSLYVTGKRPLSPKFVRRMCEHYGINPQWFDTGLGPKYLVNNIDKSTSDAEPLTEKAPPKYQIKEAMKIGRIESLKRERGEVNFLPVVSWASAGRAHDYQNMQGFIDEDVRSTAKDPHCFALRVEGDSMEPRYFSGDLVVLDPHREPRSGNRVVARLKENEGVLFKLYTVTGNDVTLSSYNPMYPPLKFKRSDFLWIYTVVELIRKEAL